MGVISVTTESYAALVDGYPLEGTTYYIYCDRCGSFNIRTHIKITHWILLILLAIIIAVCWNYFLAQEVYWTEQFACWSIYLIFIVAIVGFLSRYFPHKCMKCGNTEITYQDVLNYSKADKPILFDVPEYMLHKHNRKSVDFVKDVKAIPFLIYEILVVLLMPLIILVGSVIDYLHSRKNKKE